MTPWEDLRTLKTREASEPQQISTSASEPCVLACEPGACMVQTNSPRGRVCWLRRAA